jgi:uncharacterized protein YbjT (DUF2867 family)
MKLAVAGATGRAGRHLVDVLESEGHDVVPISRSTGVDVITGDGLAEALTGVEAVVDAATGPSPDEQAATDFFETAARNLQETGARAGVKRMVVVSIIGCERFGGGYGAAKVAHERAHLAGRIPVRILRASQFHEFVEQLVDWGKQGDASYVSKMRVQPVAARTVAEALAELATSSWEGEASSEIAGPREESLPDLARLFVAQNGNGLRIVDASGSDDPYRDVYESGALLPGPIATLAGPTFEEWLRLS